MMKTGVYYQEPKFRSFHSSGYMYRVNQMYYLEKLAAGLASKPTNRLHNVTQISAKEAKLHQSYFHFIYDETDIVEFSASSQKHIDIKFVISGDSDQLGYLLSMMSVFACSARDKILNTLSKNLDGGSYEFSMGAYEPRCEKTGLRGFRPGPTQTRLFSHTRWLEARNFVFRT